MKIWYIIWYKDIYSLFKIDGEIVKKIQENIQSIENKRERESERGGRGEIFLIIM
jgi:hypothetical protein